MTINNINKGGYPDKNIRKSEQNRSVSKSGGNGPSASSNVEGQSRDTFTPTSPEMKGDIEFGRKVLADLDRNAFPDLKKIKQNIERGEYNREEIHQKVGSLIQKDLDSLRGILTEGTGSGGTGEETKKLTGEYREYLVENPSVLRKVADGIAGDIEKL